MLKINTVFSDGAVLQQNTVIELRGSSDKDSEVKATLYLGKKKIRTSSGKTDSEGHYSVPMKTESASFDEYRIVITNGSDELTVKNILFGEVWLAAGQSNMEMRNNVIDECEEILDTAGKYVIRYYRLTTPYDINVFDGKPYPLEPIYDNPGKWTPSSDRGGFSEASAAASEFAVVLAEKFAREGKNIPVAFIDTSVGGSTIESWFPKEYTEGELRGYLEKANRYTAPEDMNVKPHFAFFQQPYVLYNAHTHATLGSKFRGIIWYQGESDVFPERFAEEFYCKMITTYHKVYKELFAADKNERFPLICSQIFPWLYGVNTGIRLGYINLALSRAAGINGEISVAPIHDLPVKWSYAFDYHPIHPNNKCDVGKRMAKLALTNCYGEKGLKTAVGVKSVKKKRGAIEITFDTLGNPLNCPEKKLRGFCICGKRQTYIAADARITGKNRITVSSEYIKTPYYVCYQLTDLEHGGNLFCGGMPVVPFTTQESGELTIAPKPWQFADIESQFRCGEGDDLNYFLYPVRYPSQNSALNYDHAYDAIRLSGIGGNKRLGMYFKPEFTMPIDLFNYTAAEFTVYARPEVEISAVLTLRRENEVKTRTVKAKTVCNVQNGTVRVTIPLRVPCDTVTEKFELVFDTEKLKYNTVAVGDIRLVPKK